MNIKTAPPDPPPLPYIIFTRSVKLDIPLSYFLTYTLNADSVDFF